MRLDKVVFLVEDDPDDQEFFLKALKVIDADIICFIVSDGEEAIQKLKRLRFVPEIIFLDLNMPKMDGESCLAEIQKVNSLRNVPVVVCSTAVRPDEVDKYKAKGAAQVLAKPPTFDKLVSMLRTTLHTYLPK
jgi:CheY-like chemotaxis protein